MLGPRKKVLQPYIRELTQLYHKTHSRRVIGAHLRYMRDRGILRDLHEQQWLGNQVTLAYEADLAYYRSVTPKE